MKLEKQKEYLVKFTTGTRPCTFTCFAGKGKIKVVDHRGHCHPQTVKRSQLVGEVPAVSESSKETA